MEFPQLMAQAVTAYKARDLQTAEEICRDIREVVPDHVEALYLQGLCLCRTGHRDAGREAISQALSMKPELEAYDLQRGRLIQQGVSDEVIHWEQRLLLYLSYLSVDAFLISYPKCGRTWLRALLGQYVLGSRTDRDPLEVLKLTRTDPAFTTLAVTHDDDPHWKPPETLFRDKRAYLGKKVIFLTRDPRDILVSNYFEYTRRGGTEIARDTFAGDISSFIRHDIGGLKGLVGFYNVWAECQSVPAAFLHITYEELSDNTRAVFERCLDFLQWPQRDPAFLEEVMNFGSFANMRRLEESDTLKSPRLKPPRDGDPDGFKVRRGKVGGYIDYLSAEDVAFVDTVLDDQLADFYALYKNRGR